MTARKANKVRCSAKTRSGALCKNYAREGFKVCRMHGAGNRSKPGGRPAIHGAYSMRYQNLTAEGAERLAELERDPELMNLRRTVAASQLAVEQTPLFPSDEMVRRYAEGRAKDKEAGPDEAEMILARQELLAYAHKSLVAHGRLQNDGARQLAASKMLQEAALPLIRTGFARIAVLSKKYIKEGQFEAFLDDLDNEIAALSAQLVELGGATGRR